MNKFLSSSFALLLIVKVALYFGLMSILEMLERRMFGNTRRVIYNGLRRIYKID